MEYSMEQLALKTKIKKRILDCQMEGRRTSKGERMTMASIARAMDPPVHHATIFMVVYGRSESRRVQAGIERELGERFW